MTVERRRSRVVDTARLQGQAGAGELVLMRPLAQQPEIAEPVIDAPPRALTAHLEGIADAQPLVAIDLRADPAEDRGVFASHPHPSALWSTLVGSTCACGPGG